MAGFLKPPRSRPLKESDWTQLGKSRPDRGRPQFDFAVRTGGGFSPWAFPPGRLGVALRRLTLKAKPRPCGRELMMVGFNKPFNFNVVLVASAPAGYTPYLHRLPDVTNCGTLPWTDGKAKPPSEAPTSSALPVSPPSKRRP